MNKIGLFNWHIFLKEFHEFRLVSSKNPTKGLRKGKDEVTTSVVDVKVFYTITPEIFCFIFGSPDA
jgi:hypothetical protein